MQRLVDQHYEALYRYAYRLSGRATDAEDLTQDAFCQAQTKLGQLRDEQCAKAWLFSIVRNRYLHRFRDSQRQPVVPLESVGELSDKLPRQLPEIEPAQLQEALNELPEEFRTPLILFFFEDFTYRDIADQMNLPIGTVMSRLARAKTHLRSRLMKSGLSGLPARNDEEPEGRGQMKPNVHPSSLVPHPSDPAVRLPEEVK
jgi:RNA polymerase sigma-70 factor (ECF subfamily)